MINLWSIFDHSSGKSNCRHRHFLLSLNTGQQVRELGSFARGIRLDQAAVTAGLTLEISQGQVEGQVNRLKTLKRAMYGRASFETLKARVLHRKAA